MKIFIGMQSPTAARIKKVGHMKTLVLNPKWKLLAKVRDLAPNVPGLYMMAFDKPVNYDKGTSRVIYIGSSLSIRERLRSHYNNMKVYFIDFVTKGDMGKVFSCFFQVEVASQDELLTIEQMAFDEFAKKFGVQPLGNWMPKTTDLIGEILLGEKSEDAKSFVEHVEDDSREHALTFDEIAEKYDLEYERDEWSPRIMFHPKGTFKRWEEIDIEFLKKIRWDHIVCWDKSKYEQLIKIANLLQEDKKKKLKTRRFESLTDKVPEPHTWGEVTVALARMIAGTWYPENRILVEIRHKGNVLGKASIKKSGCTGRDTTIRPQRSDRRPYWNSLIYEINEKAEEEARKLYKEGKASSPNAIGRIVDAGDYLEFRLFDRVVAQREKDFKERPEKIFRDALAEIEVG